MAVPAASARCFPPWTIVFDGRTPTWNPDLTTPESMDAFRMMRARPLITAWNIVMEVSLAGLQGGPRVRSHIRRGRVPQHQPGPYQPDRASDIRGLSPLQASDRQELPCPLVLGADCARADLIRQDARHASVPVTTFALGGDSHGNVMAAPANDDHSRFSIVIDGTSIGELSLTLDGDFNYANAAAAVAIAHAGRFRFRFPQQGRVA